MQEEAGIHRGRGADRLPGWAGDVTHSSSVRRGSAEASSCLLALAGAFVFAALRARFAHPSVTEFGALYRGTASLPFQYRDLVPMLVRGVVRVTGIEGGRDHVLIYCVFELVATAVSLLAAIKLLQRISASPSWVLVLCIMLLGNYVCPPTPNYFWPYDMPAVAFMTLGLLLLIGRRWFLDYTLLPLAILNRETAVLLVVVFGLGYWRRMPLPQYAAHLLSQLAIVLAVKLALWWIFRANPGSSAWLYDNDVHAWRYLINWRFLHAPEVLAAFGFMWAPFVVALFRLRHPFLRRIVWGIPAFLVPMFFAANFSEFRVFSELLPIMMALTADGLSDLPPGLRSRLAA